MRGRKSKRGGGGKSSIAEILDSERGVSIGGVIS